MIIRLFCFVNILLLLIIELIFEFALVNIEDIRECLKINNHYITDIYMYIMKARRHKTPLLGSILIIYHRQNEVEPHCVP